MAEISRDTTSEKIKTAVTDLNNYDTEELNFPFEWINEKQAEDTLDWTSSVLKYAADIAVRVYEESQKNGLVINFDVTGFEPFNKLLRLIKEVAEETTEPNIREKIMETVRSITEETHHGN